jgi:hypothetical protein
LVQKQGQNDHSCKTKSSKISTNKWVWKTKSSVPERKKDLINKIQKAQFKNTLFEIELQNLQKESELELEKKIEMLQLELNLMSTKVKKIESEIQKKQNAQLYEKQSKAI